MSSSKSTTLTLRGTVAAPDAYGRLRFLLLERKNDKAYDTCWAALAKAARARDHYHIPYSIHEPDADGIRGEFTVTLERAKKAKYSTVDKAAYWTKFVEPLRRLSVTRQQRRICWTEIGYNSIQTSVRIAEGINSSMMSSRT